MKALRAKLKDSLKEQGIPFHLEMIGGGELEPEVRRLRAEYGLEAEVDLPGFKEPVEVRKAMERAEIYLVTSDRKEGWGAVVNEAMNSGCAVVADAMIGAVPYLIHPEENGYAYETGREDQLLASVRSLLQDRELCHRIGRNAYATIAEEWNAEVAAKRLTEFCVGKGFLKAADTTAVTTLEGAVSDETVGYALPTCGPCSVAPVISERKMYREMLRGKI